MEEPETKIYYPLGWDEEYKRIGTISAWHEEYPEMFSALTGVLPKAPYAAVGKMENFPNYALMYLLRKYHGVQSITYMRLGAKKSKEGERLQSVMRELLGNEPVDRLKVAIRAEGLLQGGFEGEPDLFCWHPQTGKWFFAEAKGKDVLLDTQRRWFRVCREVVPGVDIRVYRLIAETAMRVAGSTE